MTSPLHAELHGSGAARRRVVLVHGFTQTRRSWTPLLPHLVAVGREVMAIDAPAHGRSVDQQVDLVEGARLLGGTGGEAVYVGYSMGGRLTLHLALAAPHLLRGVVLVGATAGLESEAERAARRSADEALATDLERNGLDAFLERWLANPLFATLPVDEAAMAERKENTVAGLAASLRLMGTGTQQSLWNRLPEIEVPALFVAGERDEKFTALAHRMAAAWGGAARVGIVADAGHACHLEQPEAFCDLVLPFLDAHDGPQRTDSPAANSNP